MALLGLLSILQIVFLPGYLLVRSLRLRGGILATLVLTFALSLVANHALVAGLVVLGIYRPVVVYAVFAAETAILLEMLRRSGRTAAIDARRFRDFLGTLRLSPLRQIVLAAALSVIAGFALCGLARIGRIFQQWDAVISWNRWAIEWAAGRLPTFTSLYPQLLPANMSLTYLFIQTSDVWIFAKSFQFLFCLMLLLAMVDAARATGEFGFVPGALITYWMLVAVLRFRMIDSGYADVPLAFFAFAGVYTLLLAKHAEGAQRRRYVLVGAVLAGGAALTKQTGLYIALAYPLLAWLVVLRSGQAGELRRQAGTLLRAALLAAALAAPWYLYKLAEFHGARDFNNTPLLVNSLHEGRGLSQRLLHAANMLAEATTPAGAVLLLLATAAALRDPLQRWLVGLVVVPLGLVWAVGFSYDLRNLALILPFAGAAAGTGVLHAAERIGRRVGQARRGARAAGRRAPAHQQPHEMAGRRSPGLTGPTLPLPVFFMPRMPVGRIAGFLALATVAACLCVSDATLRRWQERQQRLVGVPAVNERLYAYLESHGEPAAIATDYAALRWLPELASRSVGCECEALDTFRAAYDRPEVRYALVRHAATAAAVQAYLDGPSARLVFEAGGYRFYAKADRIVRE
jgi:hypothetical protein